MADKFIGFLNVDNGLTDKEMLHEVASKFLLHPEETTANLLELLAATVRKDGVVDNLLAGVYQSLIEVANQVVVANFAAEEGEGEEEDDLETGLL